MLCFRNTIVGLLERYPDAGSLAELRLLFCRLQGAPLSWSFGLQQARCRHILLRGQIWALNGHMLTMLTGKACAPYQAPHHPGQTLQAASDTYTDARLCRHRPQAATVFGLHYLRHPFISITSLEAAYTCFLRSFSECRCSSVMHNRIFECNILRMSYGLRSRYLDPFRPTTPLTIVAHHRLHLEGLLERCQTRRIVHVALCRFNQRIGMYFNDCSRQQCSGVTPTV